ncbi:hypothetical protein BS50DRAFT_638480 [Corynespora cassiicola Philippines]|uniref:Uncharacterized protein n=1 Tax=Corynespora cassiicola Philippines TaxID=1448308 RepID=A0A2T2NCW6_CORCC|nr:hypothetical protein BS50DRAFT_638480 [Corynespora cassiicola Philippines]
MPSSAAILHESLTLITYITTVKPLLLTDARALYASLGLMSHRITFDMITSHHEGQVQATLVYYPDLDLDMRFEVLRDGKRCANIGDAVDDLWASIRGDIGDMRAGVGAGGGGDGRAPPPPPLRAASGSGASGATGAGEVGSGTGKPPHSLAAANDDDKDDKDEKSVKDKEETKDEAADEDMEALPGTETENNHDSSSDSSFYSPTLPTPLAHGSSASDVSTSSAPHFTPRTDSNSEWVL